MIQLINAIMSEQTNQSEIKEKFDIEIFNEIPVITTSSPSMCSESDLLPLPVYKYRNKHANNFNSTEIVDEFDTSFINNNNSTSRRVSFLRSPTPNNMNTSGASRGVSSCETNEINKQNYINTKINYSVHI